MTNEHNDKLNKLLAHQGSIAERNLIAKELDDDSLQIAAPYSPQAKEELKRRRHERLVNSRVVTDKELEQKFEILLSFSQAQRDFDQWLAATNQKSLISIAFLFLDIDNFKRLNTQYTETEVDATLLPAVQQLIKDITTFRGGAYRHGGDEFLIILPNHDEKEAMMFAEKMRAKFETHIFRIDGIDDKLTISVGVALLPLHGVDFDSVLRSANQAEHKAKAEGRNCVKLSG